VAVTCTLVVPTGKKLPDGGLAIAGTGPSSGSAALTPKLTNAPFWWFTFFFRAVALIAFGTPMTGGLLSQKMAGTPAENSEVLPKGWVAGAVTSRRLLTATLRVTLNDALPPESVVVLTKP